MSEDDFHEIVSNNDLEDLQSESELYNMTVQDLVMGIHHMSAAMVMISNFINEYIDDEEPALSIECVVFAKNMFEYANKFVSSIALSEGYDDDDDDEEDYYDDDDSDDDE